MTGFAMQLRLPVKVFGTVSFTSTVPCRLRCDPINICMSCSMLSVPMHEMDPGSSWKSTGATSIHLSLTASASSSSRTAHYFAKSSFALTSSVSHDCSRFTVRKQNNREMYLALTIGTP